MDTERAEFRQQLAESIQAQDDLMMIDIAKVLQKMPEGSTVVAFRKFRGTVLAGVVVLNGDIGLMTEMYGKGILNPEGSPGVWRFISTTKLNLLAEFSDPPEAALAFFVLTPDGQYAFALSHIVRADGNVQWVSKTDYVGRVADVLVDSGLLQA